VTIAESPFPDLSAIQTVRLLLRPCHLGDAGQFCAMTDDPSITSAIDFLPPQFEFEDAERLIVGDGDGRDCFWGVWLNDGDEMIGTVGTHLRGPDAIEIGYWFAAKVRGRGIAAEAVTAVLAKVGSTYPGRMIFAECRPENAASWRLLEKLGFRADGGDGLRPGRKRLVLTRG
jgi:RimJ/RimL family protein N-acetyltransferase